MQVSVSGQLPEEFLWTNEEVDPTLQPVFGLVLQVGDAEKFPQALSFKSLDLLFKVSKLGPCLTALVEDAGDKRLVELELAGKADGVAAPDPV